MYGSIAPTTVHRRTAMRGTAAMLSLAGALCVFGVVLALSQDEETAPTALLYYYLAVIPADVQAHMNVIATIPTVPDFPDLTDPSEAPDGVQAFWKERDSTMDNYKGYLDTKSNYKDSGFNSATESPDELAKNYAFDPNAVFKDDVDDANDVETKAAIAHGSVASNAAKLAAWSIKIAELTPIVAEKQSTMTSLVAANATAYATYADALSAKTTKDDTITALEAAVTTATAALAAANADVTVKAAALTQANALVTSTQSTMVNDLLTSPRVQTQIDADTAAFNAASAAETAAQTASDTSVAAQASATTALASAQQALTTEEGLSPTQDDLNASLASALSAYNVANAAATAATNDYNTYNDKLTLYETNKANLLADVTKIEEAASAAAAAAGAVAPVSV